MKSKLRGLLGLHSAGSIVLLYHRVTEAQRDPQLLCVSPEHFQEHLEVISSEFIPVRLYDLAKALRNGSELPGSVVVTFDDGYADILGPGRSLLELYGIPATAFIALRFSEEGRRFWWDELEYCLFDALASHDSIEVVIGGMRYEWNLSVRDRLHKSYDDRYLRWNIEMGDDPTPRHSAYRTLYRLMKSLPDDQRELVLEQMRRLDGSFDAQRRMQRPLSPNEMKQLAEGDLIEVGAHTLTHPRLASLAAEAQWNEIAGSKHGLERILGHTVSSFAYPYGGKHDYTRESVEIVRDVGFQCACSNFPGRVVEGTDPYQLPRLLVRDWDGKEFERRLWELAVA